MSHRARLSELAKLDLVELTTWYESEGEGQLADRFQAAVDQTLSGLEANPRMGRLWLNRRPETHGLRKHAVAKPFNKTLLFYNVTERGITVVRVLRGERDIDSALTAVTPPDQN